MTIYRGVCTNNADPEGLLRIKVRIPTLHGADGESEWAWPCVPPGWPTEFAAHNDPQGGTLPHVPLKPTPTPGDGVWVMFENDDPEHPVWMGSWLKA